MARKAGSWKRFHRRDVRVLFSFLQAWVYYFSLMMLLIYISFMKVINLLITYVLVAPLLKHHQTTNVLFVIWFRTTYLATDFTIRVFPYLYALSVSFLCSHRSVLQYTYSISIVYIFPDSVWSYFPFYLSCRRVRFFFHLFAHNRCICDLNIFDFLTFLINVYIFGLLVLLSGVSFHHLTYSAP